jgi:hypothetical protein
LLVGFVSSLVLEEFDQLCGRTVALGPDEEGQDAKNQGVPEAESEGTRILVV